MKGHPISFRDGAYDALERGVERKLGLPQGLLSGIRTKGERSNADQVSSAGARTVFQIIPATRKAAIKKWGIDPYLSAENATEVAGRLLKESMDRNGGDATAAIREYHGGTDRRNWGPTNRAYVQRVTGSAPAEQGRRQSTFDRVRARRQEDTGPTIASVYEAYKAGRLEPEKIAAFEAQVREGAILLPKGAALKQGGAALAADNTLRPGVVAAYNNHSAMTDAQRARLDKEIAEGVVSLPPGATLKRPDPRSAGEYLGMGGRDVLTGVAGLVDLPLDALKGGANLIYDVTAGPITEALGGEREAPLAMGSARTGANMLADAMGLAKPETPGERMVSAINEGITGGVVTAGAALPLAGAKGVTGGVARTLSSSPVVDIAAGAGAGVAGELAQQSGAGPIGTMASALLGGGVAGGATAGARRLPRIAERFGPKTAKVVETTPREVLIDEAGALTEEGREAAVRAGVKPDELKAAYDDLESPETVVARQAGTGDTVVAEAPAKLDWTPEEIAILRKAGVEIAEDGTPVRPQRAPEAVPEAPAAASDVPAGPAAARVAEAQSEGVPLTKGDATQDFATQDAEQTLRASQSPEGDKARLFREQQQAAIQGAVERFRSGFGDPSMGPTERGAVVKDALRELRDQGKAGVSALYKQAEEAAESLGDNEKTLLDLDTAPILAKARELFIDEGVPDQVRRSLKQQMAKYGLIGENPKTVEGETTVQLRADDGEVADRIKFTGPPQKLTVSNAEDLRKAINGLYDADTSKSSQSLKGLIDDAVEAAVERAASEGVGDVGQRFKEARGAFQEQRATFNARDVIQNLIDWKKGTKTDAVLPENAIRQIFAGDLTNLRKVKAVLLSKPTETSKAAWKAIQAHGIAEIFGKAINIQTGDISGLRLNTAISKFGADKLKVLLDTADFNQLMKLRRIIKNATVPLSGTTNPSGSGYKVINFLAQQGQRLAPIVSRVPVVGTVVDGASALLKAGKASAESKATLEGVTNFKPETAAKVDAKASAKAAKAPADPMAFVRQFLELAGSERLIQPLLQGAAQASEDQ